MHKTKSSLKLLAVIIFALGLATCAFIARLWSGPISVNFLTPYLQQALLFDRRDLSLRFDDTVLALEGVGGDKEISPALKIRLTNLRVYDAQGVKLLSVPSGAVGISLSGLLHGMIAPSTIEITGPRLHVDWRGGDIFADFGGGASGARVLETLPVAVEAASAELLPWFIRELLSAPDDNSPTGYLRRIRITNADLILHEQVSNTEWRLPGTHLEFARGDNGVSLLARGMLQKTGMKSAGINVSGTYGGTSRQTDLKVDFRGLNPAQLAGQSQTMSPLKGVDMPLDGVVYVRLAADHRIVSAGFDIDSGPGAIMLPKTYPAPLHFDQVKARGHYDRKLKQFSIESLALLFGGTRFDGEGLVYAGAQGPGVHINGDITDLPLLALKDYWPPNLARGAYGWVTRNIAGGVAKSGHLSLNIAPDMWGPGPLPENVLDFHFEFAGVKAHYLRPMPPITDGAGQARLTTRTLDLTVTDARVGGLQVAQSHVHLSDINLQGQAQAKIDLHVSGPLPNALTLIDSQPLGYPTKYGLAPDSVAGMTDVRLNLGFPLRRSITLKDVQFDVDADLRQLAMPHLFKTIALDQGNLQMHVDRQGIATHGTLALNLVPFDFTWRENFGETGPYPGRMTLAGAISGGQWAALGLPVEDYVKGPGLLTVALQGKGAKILAGQGSIDLAGAEISLERLDWVKPAGAKAALSFKLEKDAEHLDFTKISYRDDRVAANGTLALGPDDSVQSGVLVNFRNGDTSLSATLARGGAGEYDLSLRANEFDARALIRKVTESNDDGPDLDLPDFRIKARIGHVLADNRAAAHDFRATARYENNLWTIVQLKGKFDNAKSFSFDLSPSAAGRKLAIASDDAGEVARAFGLFRNAVGGVLSVQAKLTGPARTQQLEGEVEVNNFKVVETPVLGNILTVGSLTGIGDLLKGDGITFDHLNIPFTFQNGAVALQKSRASGPAIGITIEGGVDLRYNSLTLNGTIVPAYSVNSILKIMPLFGNLLMGGKGEGLFALTYKVTGPVASPKVDVNPLSVLAPGFLRSIMAAFGGTNRTVSPERKAAEKKAAEDARKIMNDRPPEAKLTSGPALSPQP